jgi:hypothetical protein
MCRDYNVRFAQLDEKALAEGVDLFVAETGHTPETLNELVPRYLKEIRKDPWGSDYAYIRSGDSYDVYSYGPDKAPGSADDITVHGEGPASTTTACGALVVTHTLRTTSQQLKPERQRP